MGRTVTIQIAQVHRTFEQRAIPAAASHRAIVLLRRSSLGHARGLPAGWNWRLANASLAHLFAGMFADANVTWAASALPLQDTEPFAEAIASVHARPVLLTCDTGLSLCQLAMPSDDDTDPLLLVVNGHQFPLLDLRQVIQAHRRHRADATLVDVSGTRLPAYDERLRLAGDGCVERIDRFYDRDARGPRSSMVSDWPAVVVISRSAVRRLDAALLPPQLGQWPATMLRARMHLQGCEVSGACFDLDQPQAVHDLADAVLRTSPHWITQVGPLRERAQQVWVARNAHIDPSAKIIGPVAIGDDAVVGPNAVIVGPATIGARASIASGLVVRRCALGSGMALGPVRYDAERPIRLQALVHTDRHRLGYLRPRAFRIVKRSIDIAGSLLGLCATLPLYPLIAIAIKLNSRGPVFYGHVRQGYRGRPFRCWKFRTMVRYAEWAQQELAAYNEVDGPQFKIQRDPRVFAVGRWLRRFNIDEWPQFFNVLLGEMSLVGPRPSPDQENQMCPAWREARLSVLPGITGLWQVSRRRAGQTDFQEWIYYDIQYVNQQSIWLDLKILFRTIRVMLKGA
jgi:lipopolysaccharide/colanic/teichoic acid biosynthesis glycosyltransferase